MNNYFLQNSRTSIGSQGELYETKASMDAAFRANFPHCSGSVSGYRGYVEDGPDIDPALWGPGKWAELHLMSLRYPLYPDIETQGSMVDYIYRIPRSLPCSVCRRHAQEYLKAHERDIPWAVQSQRNLFILFVAFHNDVNRRNGKPQLRYEDALAIWTNTYQL